MRLDPLKSNRKPPGQNEILHSPLMLPCRWQIHRLWCMKSEFGLNSKIGRITGLVICDTCVHLLSSDDKWKWIGVREIARVQGFILGVAKREQALQRHGAPSANTFIIHSLYTTSVCLHSTLKACLSIYQRINLIWTSSRLLLALF